ncbi:MAG: hypothetical protein QOD55_1720 [Solirubrobacteraceae bacterium]|nr:hypothetical protein [Solirubrobacteraceae bacterium]
MPSAPSVDTAPRVSCIVTTYNLARFLGHALDSVLAQSYPAESLEIIVVDDGSTDDTAAVVLPYGDRVRYLRQENGGHASAVNRGLAEATGEFIALLDADDTWPPDKVARQVAFLREHPATGLVHGDMRLIDEHGRTTHESFFAKQQMAPPAGHVLGALLVSNFVSGGATMVRASLKDRFFPIAPAAAYPDWWIAANVAAVAQIHHLGGSLNDYRYHGANDALGSSEAEIDGLLRRELPWRRWMLTRLHSGPVTASDLIAAYKTFENSAVRVALRFGLRVSELVQVDDDDRRRSAEAAALGAAAFDAGDHETAVRHLACALGHDPWNGAARADLEAARFVLEHRHAARAAAPSELPDLDARAFVTLAFAEEVIENPAILRAYGEAFGAADDATLVLAFTTGPDADEITARLGELVEACGLGGEDGPDLLAYAGPPDDAVRWALVAQVHALVSARPPAGPLAVVPRVAPHDVAALPARAEARRAAVPAGAA